MPSNFSAPVNNSPATWEKGRLAPLDGIRGIAALSILLWHFGPSLAVAPIGSPLAYLARLLSLCWAGVDIFFVLSGYLIGMILLRERDSTGYFRVFYARRALRILPLYYILLGIFTVSSLGVVSPAASFLGPGFVALPIWSYWLFLQNFFMAAADQFGCPLLGVSWSLAIEEQFYLCLPLVIRYVAPRRLPWVLIPAIVVAPLLRFRFGGMESYVLLPFRMDDLLLGVLLAWWMTQPLRADRRRLIACLLGVLALIALPVLKSGAGLRALHAPGGWLLHTWIALMTCGVLALVLLSSPSSRLIRALAWPPLRWAGVRAYGIYLLHPWALYLTFAAFGLSEVKLTPTFGGLQVLIAAAITFLAAEISFRWLELPFLRLGHRLRYGAPESGTLRSTTP